MNSKLPKELFFSITNFFDSSDTKNHSIINSFDSYILKASPQVQEFCSDINQLFSKFSCFNDNFLNLVESYNSLLTYYSLNFLLTVFFSLFF